MNGENVPDRDETGERPTPIEGTLSPRLPPIDAAAKTGGPRPVVAPPALWRRVIDLTLKPESWAESLRFPLLHTLGAVALAILLAALTIAATRGFGALTAARAFAARYDANYPAIKYEAGKLTPLGKGGPIRIKAANGDLIIDATGKTTPADLGEQPFILVTDTAVYQHVFPLGGTLSVQECAKLLQMNDGLVIDGPYLSRWLNRRGWVLVTFAGVGGFVASALQNVIWALMMTLVLGPVVQLSAAKLRMPRRVAYRAAAAITVPLIMLDAGLMAFGVGPRQVMPAEGVSFFWFFAAAALACWAGILSVPMYRPKKAQRRGT